ncbi:hypothetical protein [Paenibacillus graminis]|uniref:hypothetical protein n=1 Tax=Paenibacillus graminis TaxID=189425 RepID=UPI0004BC55CD|nr:hypothetical protein [Paenibacillus graminis]MEC0166981.1 hypothetical protein [Paenibacillus graminis]
MKKTAGAGVQGIKCLLKSGAKLASRSGSMNIRRDQESAKKAHEGLKSCLTGSSEA